MAEMITDSLSAANYVAISKLCRHHHQLLLLDWLLIILLYRQQHNCEIN